MDNLFSMFIAAIIGFIFGIIIYCSSSTLNSEIAIKLSNVMNASMLDLVTHNVITKEQVHDIETIFQKHIEGNFEHIKASHGEKE